MGTHQLIFRVQVLHVAVFQNIINCIFNHVFLFIFHWSTNKPIFISTSCVCVKFVKAMTNGMEMEWLVTYCTLQEHQWILTNVTVSKDSDTISISVLMAVYEIFFHFSSKSQKSRNSYQHDITKKYYKIGRSELC